MGSLLFLWLLWLFFLVVWVCLFGWFFLFSFFSPPWPGWIRWAGKAKGRFGDLIQVWRWTKPGAPKFCCCVPDVYILYHPSLSHARVAHPPCGTGNGLHCSCGFDRQAASPGLQSKPKVFCKGRTCFSLSLTGIKLILSKPVGPFKALKHALNSYIFVLQGTRFGWRSHMECASPDGCWHGAGERDKSLYKPRRWNS